MAYATFDDVMKRYNPLVTLIGSGETEVATVDISSIYISDAEGLINAYLGAKYTTPLNMPEPLITRLCADLSIYKVLEDRTSRVPEIAASRYTDACSILGMLRDGKMTLTNSQTQISSGDWEAFSSTASYHPVFSPVLRDVDQREDRNQVDTDRAERINDITDCGP